jgi:hypothetical protein
MEFLKRLLGVLLAVAALVAAFFLLWVVLAAVLVAALVLWAWVRWRTRDQPRAHGPGEVVEGEVVASEVRIRREFRIGRDVRRGDDKAD